MFATYRKLKVNPGSAAEVAALIQAEYMPLLDDVPGFVSYTLVDLGDDEITSIGVFQSAESAAEANARAKSWVGERLSPFVATPLDAREGAVLVNYLDTP
ncbi:antibiotic biosynthesis monooxygenase [Spongisporangium articulatum]|uniref:Antibiotic biosynthesis monooxygenase n=1 Tax=Spongisporangium articulatum TaxID=3362603 RepID=A0ABW8AQ23_9ACTN